MRRASVVIAVILCSLAFAAAPAVAGAATHGHGLKVAFDTPKCSQGRGTAGIEILGIWDDTDIVHVTGTARFHCRIDGGVAHLSGIEFTGMATTSKGQVPVRGRILGIFADGFESYSGLLLPAVQ